VIPEFKNEKWSDSVRKHAAKMLFRGDQQDLRLSATMVPTAITAILGPIAQSIGDLLSAVPGKYSQA
jgi:hypothetical protein